MNIWQIIISMICLVYKIETGKIRQNFDEIFGKEWDKNQREEQLIKIEQNEQNQNIHFVDQLDGENETYPNDQQKRETINKFEAIKEKLKQKGKYQGKNRVKIERKIGKLLGTNRQKIYKWKKELNLNKKMQKNFYVQKKKEFIERFDEFKHLYGQGKQKEFIKKLGISHDTIWKWKKELIPNYYKTHNKYSNDDKLMKMKQYFGIKEANPKIRDEIIAGKLEIRFSTLRKWKKEF